METRLILRLLAAGFLATVSARAAEPDPVPAEARPTLAFVIAESLGGPTSALDDFVRVETGLQKLAKERKWPVEIVVKRFAANMPDYENQVTIFIQPVRQEVPGDYVLRGWTTLVLAGKKYDFGILKGDYLPYPGEPSDRVLEKLFFDFAVEAVHRIEMVYPVVRRERARRKP